MENLQNLIQVSGTQPDICLKDIISQYLIFENKDSKRYCFPFDKYIIIVHVEHLVHHEEVFFVSLRAEGFLKYSHFVDDLVFLRNQNIFNFCSYIDIPNISNFECTSRFNKELCYFLTKMI